MKSARTILQALLCLTMTLATVSCQRTMAPSTISGIQLWEGGPWWSASNFRADTDQFDFSTSNDVIPSGWRLPSVEDFYNLSVYCTWTWDETPGKEGFLVEGPNGNTMFLPAEGYLSRNIQPANVGGLGHYWTSDPDATSSRGIEWYFNEFARGTHVRGKDNGLSLRPVCDAYSPLMAEVSNCVSYTGRGNDGESLFTVSTTSQEKKFKPTVEVNVDAPEGTISVLKLVCEGKTLCTKAYEGPASYKLVSSRKVASGSQLQVSVDICEDAPEGALVKACLKSLEDGSVSASLFGNMESEREVMLTQKCLYRPGDYGSNNWRIPALRQLSDGTLLAVNDRRNVTERDLPERIDVVFRYSTDNGRTWSEPGFIAKNFGFMHGYGDPALVECEDGTVICFFAGGETFTRSSLDNPQRSFYSVSKDFGRTWTDPEEITAQIWGPDAINPFCQRYKSSFFSSGNGLILASGEHKGRILVSNVLSYTGWDGLCNHAVYSDDCGKTWNVSELAFADSGDEAKMVELTDGSILMSVRQEGDRAYSISHDGGQTWTEQGYWPEMHVTACNGDLIRYDSNTLLQTVPDAMYRRDVTVYVSFDDGKTWPYKKVICHGPSSYSSITVLPDGNIGVFYEKGYENIELWYESFSIDWLLR